MVRTLNINTEALGFWDILGRATVGLCLLIGGFVVKNEVRMADHDSRIGSIERALNERTEILRRISEQLSELKVAIARLEVKNGK